MYMKRTDFTQIEYSYKDKNKNHFVDPIPIFEGRGGFVAGGGGRAYD